MMKSDENENTNENGTIHSSLSNDSVNERDDSNAIGNSDDKKSNEENVKAKNEMKHNMHDENSSSSVDLLLLRKTLEENKMLQEKLKDMDDMIASLQVTMKNQSVESSVDYKSELSVPKQSSWFSKLISFPSLSKRDDHMPISEHSDLDIEIRELNQSKIDERDVFVIDDNDGDMDDEKGLNGSTEDFSSLMRNTDDKEEYVNALDNLNPPNISFTNQSFSEQLKDRASWLIGLLILQSCSSFILKRNEDLLQGHLEIVHFLTMLVGAGGNAGNQACVRGRLSTTNYFVSFLFVTHTMNSLCFPVIRELALGTLNSESRKPFLITEAKMGICLSVILALSGLSRALLFGVPIPETTAITASLWTIVFLSVGIGALLPLLMKFVGIDPAHSSTTIQVVMDILGVSITVGVSSLILSKVGRL